MEKSLKNKRFLITQPLIRGINGSTVVTLELAEELQRLGAKVTVYTCDHGEPAKSYYTQKNITVNTAQDNPNYKLNNFDYIWVHSQILPPCIIKQLSQKISNKTPSFIFLHMSGMDWIPDEKPWIYDLENRLSSLSLFICEEVKDINKPFLDSSIPTAFFRNPTPTEFKDRNKKPSETLSRMLLVSNHPSKELLEAKQLLEEKHHIAIDGLGETQENYKLFNKQLLEKYDAIITIAKTVPYCLVSGTPVYVYDIYAGGPGWLSQTNFTKAKERNFSGYQNFKYPKSEGGVFHFKTPDQIVNEIVSGYQSSLSFHQKNMLAFQEEFVIDSVLPKILSNIKPKTIKPLPEKLANSIIAAEQFAAIKFETGGLLYIRDEHIHQLEKQLHLLKKQNQELIDYKNAAEKVFNSHAYRTFNKVIKPYKKVIRRNKDDK